MGMSDKIEAFIIELLKDDTDFAEFGRNQLADIFGCVPSQINYVISTRFSPERGYSVESRRGGGGYIKIRRIASPTAGSVIEQIGSSCDLSTARAVIARLYEENMLSEQTAAVLSAAISDKSLLIDNPARDILRANILKNALCEIK